MKHCPCGCIDATIIIILCGVVGEWTQKRNSSRHSPDKSQKYNNNSDLFFIIILNWKNRIESKMWLELGRAHHQQTAWFLIMKRINMHVKFWVNLRKGFPRFLFNYSDHINCLRCWHWMLRTKIKDITEIFWDFVLREIRKTTEFPGGISVIFASNYN